MEELVSIIIPTYKRSDMLSRTLDSVLTQSYKNIEIIVVDDNDPNTSYREKTEKTMEAFKRESRVQYVKHNKNMNGSAARNTGIEKSNGKYLCFLDDDDYFLKEKITKQVDFLEKNHEYGAVCCDYKKNEKRFTFSIKDDYTKEILLMSNGPQTSGIMFRRSAIITINGFDATYTRHQDFEILLRFFDAGFKMGKIDEVLYFRDVSKISNIPNGKKMEILKKKFLGQFDYIIKKIDSNEPGFKKKVLTKHYEQVMKSYLKDHNLKKGFVFFMKSICCNPVYFIKEIKNEILIRK